MIVYYTDMSASDTDGYYWRVTKYDHTVSTTDDFTVWVYSATTYRVSDVIREVWIPEPAHKDPLYWLKTEWHREAQEAKIRLMLALMFNIYAASFVRRSLLAKSGFVARAGKRRKGR